MAFRTYNEGLRAANVRAMHILLKVQLDPDRVKDAASKAVLTESYLSNLSPVTSPVPTLLKAFPLYISAAEVYSNLLSSSLVPETERSGIKRKWRLVLERAEKVKRRVEELGGQVGRAAVSEQGEEDAIARRGGVINGIHLEMWSEPSEREWNLGDEAFRDKSQPELSNEQKSLGAEWVELPRSAWDVPDDKETRWRVKQGPGADCSVVAALGVCMEHNRRWGTMASSRRSYALVPRLIVETISLGRTLYILEQLLVGRDTPRMANMY